MTKQTRVSFIRSRALALRCVSLASIGAPMVAQASVSAHESVSPSPMRSAHVWRKSATQDSANDAQGESLPANFTPSPVLPFVPAVNPQDDKEAKAIAYVEALPEIFRADCEHVYNCQPLRLEWKG